MQSISRFTKENSSEALEAARAKGYTDEEINAALEQHYSSNNEPIVNGDGKGLGTVEDAKQFSNSLAPGSASAPTGMSNALAGMVKSGAKGMTNTGSPVVDGIKNSIVDTIGNVAAGKEVDGKQVATDAAKNALATYGTQAASSVLGPASAFAGTGVRMGIDALTGKDVDVTSNLSSTTGSIMGSMALSPLGPLGMFAGSMIGGTFGGWAGQDGFVGDTFDTRSNETLRDTVEDNGSTYSQSRDASQQFDNNQESVEASINGDPRGGDVDSGVSPAADYDDDKDSDEAYA